MKSLDIDKEKVQEVKKRVNQGIVSSETEIIPVRAQIGKLESLIKKKEKTIQADKRCAKELEKLLTAKK